jgi:membrane-bound lytic murein transglycosylase D
MSYTQLFGVVDKNLTTVQADQLKERLENIASEVDLRYTSEVHEIINTYIKNYRYGSEQLLGRTERYFPIYEQEFERRGVPDELKYLSVIESSLSPRARSQVGAVGLWQFMRATGKLYGLTINSVVDERREPIRSTEAASNFLKDLYIEFGDWTLALAAYNCGPGNVRKALKRSTGSEFWEIKPYLPRETRRYVPKYVAMSYLMNYFHLHGLEPIEENTHSRFATTVVYNYESFREISQKSGADINAIYKLNPAFLKGYIPKSTKGYLLTLPEDEMYNYLLATDGFDNLVYTHNKNEFLNSTTYLYTSMKKRMSELIEVERIPTNRALLTVRSKVNIAEMPTSRLNQDIKKRSAKGEKGKNITLHTIKAQQSLYDVSLLYAVRMEDLIEINEIDPSAPPGPGSVIRVPHSNS